MIGGAEVEITAAGARFATIFDDPAPGVRPPFTVTGGQERTLQVVDRFVRGIKIIGRFSATPGLLAVAVRGDGGPLRVALRIRLDATAVSWWEARSTVDEIGDRAQLAGRPRLVTISSQGRLRQAILLSVGAGVPGRPAEATACAVFDLDPAEVPADGLITIELGDARVASAVVADLVAPESAVGLRVDQIDVRPGGGMSPTVALAVAVSGDAEAAAAGDAAPEALIPPQEAEATALVSTGGVVRTAGGASMLDVGLLVVNPSPGAAATRLRLRADRLPAPPAKRPGRLRRALRRAARWCGRLSPRRIVRRLSRGSSHRAHAAGASWVPTPDLSAIRLDDGTSVEIVVVRCPDGQVDVTVPAGVGVPVLIGVAPPRRAPGPRKGSPVWRLAGVRLDELSQAWPDPLRAGSPPAAEALPSLRS